MPNKRCGGLQKVEIATLLDKFIVCIAPVAQLDRAWDYGSQGCRFDSCRARHFNFYREKSMNHLYFLEEALKEAEKAFFFGEVPIGAIIVKDNEIISRAFNRKEFLQDPTAHAEILAIREAALKLNSWRLNDCVLYSTVEPCVMCCGAIIQARIKTVVYGVPDRKFGGVESLYSILEDKRNNHRPEVIRLNFPPAEELLKKFFKILRTSGEVPEPGLTGPTRNRVTP